MKQGSEGIMSYYNEMLILWAEVQTNIYILITLQNLYVCYPIYIIYTFYIMYTFSIVQSEKQKNDGLVFSYFLKN